MRYRHEADELRTRLAGVDKSDLVNVMTSYAETDSAFYQYLRLRFGTDTAANSAGGSNDEFMSAIDRLLGNDDFPPYLDHEDQCRVHRLTESIRELIKRGRAADAIQLSEHCFQYVDKVAAVQEPDDFLGECFSDIIDVHKAASVAAGIDCRTMAEQVFAWERTDNYGAFSDARRIYADALGDAGIQKYKELKAEALAEKCRREKAKAELPFEEQDDSIMSLSMTVRAYTSLKRAGVSTIAQLASMSRDDLTKIKHLGRRGADEVISKLRAIGRA